MKEILEKIKGKFVDLHVHDLSDKDAHIEPKKIVEKLKSLGRKGMASTFLVRLKIMEAITAPPC